MKTDQDASERDYLEFVSANVLPWNPEERASVESAWAVLQPKLDRMALPWPDTVFFIKTTGLEEGGQEYTRGNEIVLPQSALAAKARASLEGTIAHELFHILSRNAPKLRESLYSLIGFQPCGEVPFPSSPLKSSPIRTHPKTIIAFSSMLMAGQLGPYRYSFRKPPTITWPKAEHFFSTSN